MAEQFLEFKIKAVDEASGIFHRAGENARRATARAMGGEGETIEGLKGAFGRGSKFDAYAKLLEGGGAVLGLGIAGKLLDDFSEKLLEVKKLAQEGAGFPELALKVGESIPVFGSIVKAGENINELFTGAKAAADAEAKSIDTINKGIEAWEAGMRRIRDEAKQAAEEIRKIDQQTDLIGSTGPARDYAEHKQQLDNLRQKYIDAQAAGDQTPQELQRRIDDTRAKHADAIAKARAQEIEAMKAAGAAANNSPAPQMLESDDPEVRRAGKANMDAFYGEANLLRKERVLLEKQADQDVAQVKATWFATNKHETVQAEAELADIRKQYGEEYVKAEAAIKQRIADLRTEANAASLRDAAVLLAREQADARKHKDDANLEKITKLAGSILETLDRMASQGAATQSIFGHG